MEKRDIFLLEGYDLKICNCWGNRSFTQQLKEENEKDKTCL